MKYKSPFLLPLEEYRRDLNVIEHYISQNAFLLHKSTGQPLVVCEDYIRENLKPGGRFEFKDPRVNFTWRDKNGDRSQKQATYLAYINQAIANNDIIAPTLTTYYHPAIKKSLQVDSIINEKKIRSVNKAKMFAAQRDKDKEKEVFFKIAQTGNKLSNNAVSGGYCSSSTIMFNPSAHTTLTSTCRITAGYGNVNNEKILSGNRHYYDAEVVINNIMSVCVNTNYDQLNNTIALYNLRCPSKEETFEYILRCTRLYWKDVAQETRIWDLVKTLNAPERAAFVYTGDLYGIRVFNEDIVQRFIDELSTPSTSPHPEPNTVFDGLPSDIRILATQIHSDFDIEKGLEKIVGTEQYAIIANTALNIINTLEKYKPFIQTFFLTRNVPPSLAYFPSAVRRTVLMGDTDSTIFTVQDWVKWMTGSYAFTPRSIGICETMLFLSGQCITHCLALMSANIGVAKELLFEIAMKNEFRFDTFTPTPVAKHYHAMRGRQEENTFPDRKIEIKGVHLKNSNAPLSIMNAASERMIYVNNKVIAGESISLTEELQFIANIEHSIVRAIKRGYHGYFRIQKIKNKDAYKQDETVSKYLNYTMWQDVFEPKYGTVDPPPFPSLKINTDFRNKTDWEEWLANLPDRQFVERLKQFCTRYDKKIIKTFYIPLGYIIDNGVPDELMRVIDIRRIVLDNTKVFYLLLEALGYCCVDKKISRLAMDMFPMTEEFKIQ